MVLTPSISRFPSAPTIFAAAASRLSAQTTTLARSESKYGETTVPAAIPASTRMPIPSGGRILVTVPGEGQEPELWSLGVDSALQGVPDLFRLAAVQPVTLGGEDLLVDQIHPGDQLGDRVLHLQPSVHLEEVEASFSKEPLDCPDPV